MLQNFYKQVLTPVYSDSLKSRSSRGKKIWNGEKQQLELNGKMDS